ncbi:hypothetical protein OU416_31625 [Saccharopolyspora indica]|nr:hypothetical protein [Saccharopolyspora indica]MDA3648648.1 hypothetical protein [Saccharopolyspora indica]
MQEGDNRQRTDPASRRPPPVEIFTGATVTPARTVIAPSAD